MMAHNLCYTTLLRPGAAQKLGYAAFIHGAPSNHPEPWFQGLLDQGQGKGDMGVRNPTGYGWRLLERLKQVLGGGLQKEVDLGRNLGKGRLLES